MARKHPTHIVSAALLLLFVACDTTSVLPENVEQALYRDGRCDNEGGLVENELRRQEGSLSGDMDGDGSDDEVYIVADRAAEPGCRSFLVIAAGSSQYSVPIDPSGTPRALEVPTLNALAEVNDEPGLEVVVNVEMGASTQFVSVFTLIERRAYQLEIRGKGPGPFAQDLGQDELFPFGGSVGHLEAVDCSEGGHVVMSVALPKGDSADEYVVERRVFDVSIKELTIDEKLTVKETVTVDEIDDFPEFGGSPFLSCD